MLKAYPMYACAHRSVRVLYFLTEARTFLRIASRSSCISSGRDLSK